MRQKGVDSRRVSGESLAEGYGRLANEALRRPIVDLELRALDVGQPYWLAVESFDENGVSALSPVVQIR